VEVRDDNVESVVELDTGADTEIVVSLEVEIGVISTSE